MVINQTKTKYVEMWEERNIKFRKKDSEYNFEHVNLVDYLEVIFINWEKEGNEINKENQVC